MNKPLKVGLLGVGQRGLQHLKALWQLQSEGLVEISVLADSFAANLDGDKIRNLYENNLGYDPISRSKNTFRYINLVKWLMEYKISTIVAVISPFEKDRDVCRKEIKNYKEIYLSCSLEERIKRDKKKLYIPALKGEKKHVVDVDIPF